MFDIEFWSDGVYSFDEAGFGGYAAILQDGGLPRPPLPPPN